MTGGWQDMLLTVKRTPPTDRIAGSSGKAANERVAG
jgi:hypothetical protein